MSLQSVDVSPGSPVRWIRGHFVEIERVAKVRCVLESTAFRFSHGRADVRANTRSLMAQRCIHCGDHLPRSGSGDAPAAVSGLDGASICMGPGEFLRAARFNRSSAASMSGMFQRSVHCRANGTKSPAASNLAGRRASQ